MKLLVRQAGFSRDGDEVAIDCGERCPIGEVVWVDLDGPKGLRRWFETLTVVGPSEQEIHVPHRHAGIYLLHLVEQMSEGLLFEAVGQCSLEYDDKWIVRVTLETVRVHPTTESEWKTIRGYFRRKGWPL